MNHRYWKKSSRSPLDTLITRTARLLVAPRRYATNTVAAGAVLAVLATNTTHARACEAEEMKRTDSGLILKVVGGSDKVEAKKGPDSSDVSFTLELLQSYYVICEDANTYKITSLRAETIEEAAKGQVGYVNKSQVFKWVTREALSFNPLIRSKERPEIVAWDDPSVFKKFIETLDMAAAPPAFRENRETTLKREQAIRPYPVLESETKKVGGSQDKRVFNVLLPAVLPPDARIVLKDKGKDVETQLGAALTGGTFSIAFDVTGSMGPFAKKVARSIRSAFEALPAEIQSSTKIGFVFYRDRDDAEKIVITPAPLPVKAATDALLEIADHVSGGGDAAEPVLDATYVAGFLFPWTGKDDQGSGRRVIMAVVGGDAKTATEGLIHDGVPSGLDVAQVASELLSQGIEVITVQAGPDDGGNLAEVMSALASQTNGSFIAWGTGEQEEKITAAVGAHLAAKRREHFREGETVLDKVTMYNGYPSIPLEVLDGAKLDVLRKAGIDFNIDSSNGGVLVREGYMLENADLMSEQIEIEKATLQGLVKLFTALGVAGVDVEAMKRSAGEAIAAIAGEDYDPKEPISSIINKKLGINFRTQLLEFDLEFLAAMNQAERVGMSKRIQDAGDKLNDFLQARQEDFDKSPAVWMSVSVLP